MQSINGSLTAGHQVVALVALDPLGGGLVEIVAELGALSKELLTSLTIPDAVVLAREGLNVFVVPVLFAAKLLEDALAGDELLQFLGTAKEVNLGGDNRVENAVNDLPET